MPQMGLPTLKRNVFKWASPPSKIHLQKESQKGKEAEEPLGFLVPRDGPSSMFYWKSCWSSRDGQGEGGSSLANPEGNHLVVDHSLSKGLLDQGQRGRGGERENSHAFLHPLLNGTHPYTTPFSFLQIAPSVETFPPCGAAQPLAI